MSKWNNRPDKVVGRTIQPEELVDLGPILFPWRFDLVKRAEFIPFYLAHKDLWERDEEVFMDVVRQNDLATYHHPRVTAERYARFMRSEPWPEQRIEGRAGRLMAGNAHVLIELYHSIVDGGWNPAYPIRLKRLKQPLRPVSGRPLTGTTVFSDGQHRLIILISQGQRSLRPDQCKIAEINSPFDPLEITDCYIEHGLCTEEEFCDFARWRYAVPEHIVDVQTLYEWGINHQVASWWEEYMHAYWPQTQEA